MIDNPPDWLREWSGQIGADLKDGLREGPGWVAFAREHGNLYHTYTVMAPDPFVAPYHSLLLERTPKTQTAEPRTWRKDQYPDYARPGQPGPDLTSDNSKARAHERSPVRSRRRSPGGRRAAPIRDLIGTSPVGLERADPPIPDGVPRRPEAGRLSSTGRRISPHLDGGLATHLYTSGTHSR